LKKAILILFCFVFLSLPALQAQNAPVTAAGRVTNATPGNPSVPVAVTVTGFNDIGQFTLTMQFDTTRVRYVSASTNPLLTGMTVTYTSPAAGQKIGSLIFTWTGTANVSLADSSSLADLTFHYVTGTGILSWAYTYESICRYKRWVNGVLTTINDSPKYLFYLNGGISNRVAPVTFAPVMTITAPGPLAVSVTVNDFTSIGAVSLNLEYDPAILTYQSFTKNAAFGSNFQVGDNPGTGGKRLIIIGWYGSVVSLANGSTLCTLNFTYATTNGTSCALSWFDSGSTCEYADGSGDVLIDMPQTVYYKNGSVSPPLTANFVADNLTPPKNTTVNFTDLSAGGASSWNWSFDRPDVVFVNGTTAFSQNPQVQFTDGGLFSATLLVTNPYLSDSEVKSGYLRAGTPGIWTGNTSSDWNTMSNWDNWLLPGSSTDVIIPPSALNWPVFTGVLIIGTHCSALTLNGTTTRLTITGNSTNP